MRVRVRELAVGLLAAVGVLGAVPSQGAVAALGEAAVQTDSVAYATAMTPNDPGYVYQWGTTQTRVNDAWSTVRGSSRVIIAVVDTGVSPVADLAGRVLPGHDFVNNDSDAGDDNGHGTMAAEVIAGAGNNHTGIAGVCWNCRILPVKVLDAKGAGGYDKIAEGIRYAADNGAQIINLSLSGTEDSADLRSAVAYADSKGSLVLAAAGNDGTSVPHYPAAIPTVLSVGGVTEQNTRYPWSDYGSWVTVTAPGCNPSQGVTGVLQMYCGTSSATPFTAGVAGLLASTNPAPTATQIRAALVASRASSGRIDAIKALAALPYAGDTVKPALSFGKRSVAGTRVSVSASAADQHGVSKVQLFANGKLVGTDTSAPYAFSFTSHKGSVTLQLRAADRAGNVTVTARTVRV